MKKTTVAVLLLASMAQASAVSTAAGSIAIGAATRGHVSGSQQATLGNQGRGLGVCFWQVPEKLQWVNLGVVSKMTVSEGWPAGSYELTLKLMDSPYGSNLTLPSKSRDESTRIAESIMKKIKDCAEAKP